MTSTYQESTLTFDKENGPPMVESDLCQPLETPALISKKLKRCSLGRRLSINGSLKELINMREHVDAPKSHKEKEADSEEIRLHSKLIDQVNAICMTLQKIDEPLEKIRFNRCAKLAHTILTAERSSVEAVVLALNLVGLLCRGSQEALELHNRFNLFDKIINWISAEEEKIAIEALLLIIGLSESHRDCKVIIRSLHGGIEKISQIAMQVDRGFLSLTALSALLCLCSSPSSLSSVPVDFGTKVLQTVDSVLSKWREGSDQHIARCLKITNILMQRELFTDFASTNLSIFQSVADILLHKADCDTLMRWVCLFVGGIQGGTTTMIQLGIFDLLVRLAGFKLAHLQATLQIPFGLSHDDQNKEQVIDLQHVGRVQLADVWFALSKFIGEGFSILARSPSHDQLSTMLEILILTADTVLKQSQSERITQSVNLASKGPSVSRRKSIEKRDLLQALSRIGETNSQLVDEEEERAKALAKADRQASEQKLLYELLFTLLQALRHRADLTLSLLEPFGGPNSQEGLPDKVECVTSLLFVLLISRIDASLEKIAAAVLIVMCDVCHAKGFQPDTLRRFMKRLCDYGLLEAIEQKAVHKSASALCNLFIEFYREGLNK